MFGSIKKYKQIFNLAIVLAVFFNAVAPLSFVVNQFANAEENSADALFGDKILICTPAGFKYISFAELEERQNHGEDEQQSHCSLCQISVDKNVLYILSTKELCLIEFHTTSNQYYITTQTQKSKARYQLASPRAPPIFL